jgi:hypothetical protein
VGSKKLVGGGTMKIANQGVPKALKKLGYPPRHIADIVGYVTENNTVKGAPHLHPGYVPPESELEAAVLHVFRGSGLLMPVPRYRIRDQDGNVISGHFAFVEDRLIMPVDGYSVHSDREAWYEDRRKRNAVVALGWGILSITYDDVCNRPQDILASVRQARRHARRMAQGMQGPGG